MSHRMRTRKFKQLMKNKQVVLKIQKKTNYLLNEPESYPLHDMRIFYGWA